MTREELDTLRSLLTRRLEELPEDQYEEVTMSMRSNYATDRFVNLVCEDWPEDEED